MSEEALAPAEAVTTDAAAPVLTSLLGDAKAEVADVAASPQDASAVKSDADGKSQDVKEGEKKQDAKAPAITPDDYGDFQIPEGFTADEAQAKSFKEFAAAQGLTKAQAQEAVNYEAARQKAHQEAWLNTSKQWVSEVKADKEIGGANLPQALSHAAKFLDTFGTPALRQALESSGMGNHPDFVRAFAKAGKALSEDGPVNTRSPAIGARDPAKVMFPDMN